MSNHEYLFDATLVACFRIQAPNKAEARRLLAAALDCASVNCGNINGVPLVGEASIEGDADLVEVDGEPV